jgi:uncharacterized membrane protein YgdD (TMEM256/DUF423 family)
MTASRIHILLAALMGAGGVVLWAMAAHGGEANVATAAQMLLIHAAAVVGVTACRKQGLIHDRAASLGASALILGAVLFSGDLALRAFQGQKLFAMAAPIGGGLMILGWLGAAVAALWPRRE